METKINKLCPEDIKWKFISSLGFVDCHHARYIDADFGLEMEVITKKLSDNFSFGSSKTYYFITGQKKEYTDIQILCDDWNEIKNYDDPNSEIVWVKVIKSKK